MSKPGEIKYFSGLDVGAAHEFTACAVLERTGDSTNTFAFAVRHLERFPPGTPYAEIREWLDSVFARRPLRDSALTIDRTGVGRPVVDLLRTGLTAQVVRVSVTAGLSASHDDRGWLVPRKELVATMQVLLQSGRLKVAPALEHADLLLRELANFKARITPSDMHNEAASWREGRHDDLVLAVAIAAWWGRRLIVLSAFCPRVIKTPPPFLRRW